MSCAQTEGDQLRACSIGHGFGGERPKPAAATCPGKTGQVREQIVRKGVCGPYGTLSEEESLCRAC